MPRRFVTRTDIDAIADAGKTELVVDDFTTVTDIGREHARERGVRLVRGPLAAATPPPPSSEADDVHAAVRAEVITRLGNTPADLDAAIRTVMTGHVEDVGRR